MALAGFGVDALVVDSRRLDLYRSRGGGDRALGVVPVAHHQAPTVLVGELREVGVDLGFQGRGEHPPGAFAHDLVDQRAVRRHPASVNYGKHGRALPADVGASAYSVT